MVAKTIKVEVAYATVERQTIIEVEVAADATVEQAVIASGILEQFPEIRAEPLKLGIFSRACQLDHPLFLGDRVEIYRPLLIDPKEHRRQRAATLSKKMA